MVIYPVVIALIGAAAVQAWSVRAPETVAFRGAGAGVAGAPAELRLPPPGGQQEQQQQITAPAGAGPQEAVAQAVTIVQRTRPHGGDRYRPGPASDDRPRVVRHGEPVTPRWRRHDYGHDTEQARAEKEVVPGSRRPQRTQLPRLPEGHKRVGDPARQRSVQPRTGLSPDQRRVGYSPSRNSWPRPAPVQPRRHDVVSGSRTRDLEQLYASKYGREAPRRRSDDPDTSIPPLPPVYRNLCRRRSLDVIQRMPAPLRSVCLDYLRSRGRFLAPRRASLSSSSSARQQEVRRPAESRVVRVRPGEVYVGPAPSRTTRRRTSRRIPRRRGARRSADLRKRSKSTRRFYKPYWPYKRNGQRYF